MFHHCDANLSGSNCSNHKNENRGNMDFSAYMGAAYGYPGSDATYIKGSVNCNINLKVAVRGEKRRRKA